MRTRKRKISATAEAFSAEDAQPNNATPPGSPPRAPLGTMDHNSPPRQAEPQRAQSGSPPPTTSPPPIRRPPPCAPERPAHTSKRARGRPTDGTTSALKLEPVEIFGNAIILPISTEFINNHKGLIFISINPLLTIVIDPNKITAIDVTFRISAFKINGQEIQQPTEEPYFSFTIPPQPSSEELGNLLLLTMCINNSVVPFPFDSLKFTSTKPEKESQLKISLDHLLPQYHMAVGKLSPVPYGGTLYDNLGTIIVWKENETVKSLYIRSQQELHDLIEKRKRDDEKAAGSSSDTAADASSAQWKPCNDSTTKETDLRSTTTGKRGCEPEDPHTSLAASHYGQKSTLRSSMFKVTEQTNIQTDKNPLSFSAQPPAIGSGIK